MADRKLKLVYSSTESEVAMEQRATWGFENARQLSLFDELDKISIILIPVADTSVHSFREILRDREPKLIVDTRTFPDFFSIFASIDFAMSEFQSMGIVYDRVPLSSDDHEDRNWANLKSLKELFVTYLDKRIDAPVVLLASTKANATEIANFVPGYLSQEVVETHLEDLSR